MTNELTEEQIEQFILEQTQGDRGKLEVFFNQMRKNWNKVNISSDPEQQKRYIRQEELTWLCKFLLDGATFDEALQLASEQVLVEIQELISACSEQHKIEYLNNMYRKATEEYKQAFRKLREGGYLTQADYKGKSRPKTGLKVVERAVKHQNHHESLQNEIDSLKNSVELTDAVLTVTDASVQDIQSVLGIDLTLDQKIAILLSKGKSPAVICEVLDCSRGTVSKVKKKMEEQ